LAELVEQRDDQSGWGVDQVNCPGDRRGFGEDRGGDRTELCLVVVTRRENNVRPSESTRTT
jgi:hypothetical protein